MMQLLDGKATAQKILQRLQREVKVLKKKPKLAIILVGKNPASIAYIRAKTKACAEVGIIFEQINCSEKISQKSLIQKIQQINNDSTFNGLIVQLPLPKHIDSTQIIFAIDPNKDVDGFHPFNLGKLFVGLPSLAPATPLGIIRLLESYKIALTGKRIAVIGKSNIVGKPLVTLLLNRKATVTSCDHFTKNIREITRTSDIIVSATGVPHLINSSYIKKGVVLVDVGFALKQGKLYGDIDPVSVRTKAAYLSPVPGGVGPMTVALLLENTLQAYHAQRNKLS